MDVPDLTVVSPDAGGVERARAFAKRLNAPLAIIDKRREEANVAEVMNVIGEVSGQNCLMVDDLIDTAGTLVKGAEALLEKGAASVSACATHAVLSGPAVERIEESELEGSGCYEFDSACRKRRRNRAGSNRCRSRRCWRRPSSRSTKRLRSAFCLCSQFMRAHRTHVSRPTGESDFEPAKENSS